MTLNFYNEPDKVMQQDVFVTWGNANERHELDVCIVGINRPDLLAITLRSFHRRLLQQWGQFRIVANIDPLPGCPEPSQFVTLLSEFADSGVVRFASVGNFSSAVAWVWTHSTAPIVFHLEDDWVCLKDIDRSEIELCFSRTTSSDAQVLLPKSSLAREHSLSGFTLNPSFFRGNWVRELGGRLSPEYDPEKQIRHRLISLPNAVVPTNLIVARGRGHGPVVLDSGSIWKKAVGGSKSIDASYRVTWGAVGGLGSSKHKAAIRLVSVIDSVGPLASSFLRIAQFAADWVRSKRSRS